MPISNPELETAVLVALRPQGLRDRAFRRLYPGLSTRQVLGRLPEPLQRELLAVNESEWLARRDALDRVSRALYAGVDQRQVSRTRRRLKSAMVDCFQLV